MGGRVCRRVCRGATCGQLSTPRACLAPAAGETPRATESDAEGARDASSFSSSSSDFDPYDLQVAALFTPAATSGRAGSMNQKSRVRPPKLMPGCFDWNRVHRSPGAGARGCVPPLPSLPTTPGL